MFVLVLNFLLLHSQVIIVFKVGVYNYLIQMSNNPNLCIGLGITLRPLLELTFLYKHLGSVHYLHVQLVVVFIVCYVSVLSLFYHLQHRLALHNDLLLLFSTHISSDNFRNDL